MNEGRYGVPINLRWKRIDWLGNLWIRQKSRKCSRILLKDQMSDAGQLISATNCSANAFLLGFAYCDSCQR